MKIEAAWKHHSLSTLQRFLKISKIVVLLLLPYIFWVSFAVLLNFSLWVLNL